MPKAWFTLKINRDILIPFVDLEVKMTKQTNFLDLHTKA
jgi:hypothetical protein